MLLRRRARPESRREATVANRHPMGSLGWAQCYWCWKWRRGMYIVDWIEKPLCGDCIDRLLEDEGPPWWPDARTRVELVLCRRLPADASRLIAEFARESWEP